MCVCVSFSTSLFFDTVRYSKFILYISFPQNKPFVEGVFVPFIGEYLKIKIWVLCVLIAIGVSFLLGLLGWKNKEIFVCTHTVYVSIDANSSMHTSICTVRFKNRCQLFYQQNQVYSGIADNCNLRHVSYSKTTGMSRGQKRGLTSRSKGLSCKGCSKQKGALEGTGNSTHGAVSLAELWQHLLGWALQVLLRASWCPVSEASLSSSSQYPSVWS